MVIVHTYVISLIRNVFLNIEKNTYIYIYTYGINMFHPTKSLKGLHIVVCYLMCCFYFCYERKLKKKPGGQQIYQYQQIEQSLITLSY